MDGQKLLSVSNPAAVGWAARILGLLIIAFAMFNGPSYTQTVDRIIVISATQICWVAIGCTFLICGTLYQWFRKSS